MQLRNENNVFKRKEWIEKMDWANSHEGKEILRILPSLSLLCSGPAEAAEVVLFFFFFGLGVFYVNWMSHLLSIFYHRVLSCHKLTSTASLYGTKDYHSRSRKASHSYNMGRGAQHPNSTLKGKCMTAHLLRSGIGKGKRQESRKWEYL